MEPTLARHIEITPGVCGAGLRIAGHRIRVQDVVVWHESQRFSPDEIVSRFPQAHCQRVYAALAYYHDHREEIRQHMKDDEDLVNAMKTKHPSRIVQKLAGKDAQGDSVSSG